MCRCRSISETLVGTLADTSESGFVALDDAFDCVEVVRLASLRPPFGYGGLAIAMPTFCIGCCEKLLFEELCPETCYAACYCCGWNYKLGGWFGCARLWGPAGDSAMTYCDGLVDGVI